MKCLLLISLLTSCAGNFNNIPGDTNPAHNDYCIKMNQRHRVGGTVRATAIAAGTALTGASALEVGSHNDKPALGFSLGALGAGIIAAGGEYYTQDAFNTYQEMCMK